MTAAGQINHAIRFTVELTQRAFIHPATHYASSNTDPNASPMCLRVHLKSGYDISRFTGAARESRPDGRFTRRKLLQEQLAITVDETHSHGATPHQTLSRIL